jgi:hypothetical protein
VRNEDGDGDECLKMCEDVNEDDDDYGAKTHSVQTFKMLTNKKENMFAF